MRKFAILFLLLTFGCSAFAFDIVYPKQNNVTINAKSTFFIGASSEPVTINGQDVPRHSTGAFAYVVPLKDGVNVFKVKSDSKFQQYTINKPVIKSGTYVPPQFKEYTEQKAFYVTVDNSPLRSTPVDAGINRVAHLQRNVLLNIDGEKNGFYRVVLGTGKYGWIAKTNVKQCENYINSPAKISEVTDISDENYFRYSFKLNKSVPFEIVEGENLTLKLYNIEGAKDGIYTREFSLKENFGKNKLLGYKGKYVENEFIWEIRKPLHINHKRPLKHINIVIDAGHGGSEFGAIGCLGDKEKDVVLDIVKHLEKELNKRGADVTMTRTDDTYLSLKERVDITNYTDGVIFISVHANALPDGADPNKHSGTSIYYYYNQAKPLADTLIETITSELSVNNDKVRQASFAVVRNTSALSILIETAYLINPEDNSKLMSEDFRKHYAKAIADGLEKYFINY